MTAGNNDDIASLYQELQNIQGYGGDADVQLNDITILWRLMLKRVFSFFSTLLSPDRLSFLTMLPSIWKEFAIKANILFSYIATKLLWKFERYNNKCAVNMRALTSETHNQIFSHRWDDAAGLHLWSSLLPFLAAAWVIVFIWFHVRLTTSPLALICFLRSTPERFTGSAIGCQMLTTTLQTAAPANRNGPLNLCCCALFTPQNVS